LITENWRAVEIITKSESRSPASIPAIETISSAPNGATIEERVKERVISETSTKKRIIKPAKATSTKKRIVKPKTSTKERVVKSETPTNSYGYIKTRIKEAIAEVIAEPITTESRHGSSANPAITSSDVAIHSSAIPCIILIVPSQSKLKVVVHKVIEISSVPLFSPVYR